MLYTFSTEHLHIKNTFQVYVKCSRQKRPQAKVILRMKTVYPTSTTIFIVWLICSPTWLATADTTCLLSMYTLQKQPTRKVLEQEQLFARR